MDQAEADACNLEPVVDEEYDGPLDKLPGFVVHSRHDTDSMTSLRCNPLQAGPEDATIHTDADCPV